MIARIIDWCARNRLPRLRRVACSCRRGIWSIGRMPLDALPDISDVQVIIHTTWEDEPPDIIEDQVTYPDRHLAARRATRQGGACADDVQRLVRVRGVRGRHGSLLGALARHRIPADRSPGVCRRASIRPSARTRPAPAGCMNTRSSTTTGKHSLADLRALQDWHLRYQLATVPGVAEVASIGGFVRQYQVQLDPNKLPAYGIPLSTVIDRVKGSTNEVGGRVLELSGARYMIRGLGYLTSLSDLENVPVLDEERHAGAASGISGRVSFGPDIREGVAEWHGEGETVGGIIVMRYGLNALNVIDGVKQKLAEIRASLPPGVEIVAGYDRSGLIQASIDTLKRDLLEEAAIVSLVIIVFLFHFRSALIPILALPIAVIASFIPMYYLGVSSNIMSLGGLALAIGVLVDAAIVMVENGYRQLAEATGAQRTPEPIPARERRTILLDAAKQVGPALFFSLMIIVVSFLPVFLLEAQEGRMFRPLAWTKTLAVGFSSLLAITLVPVLMVMFIRGRLRPESRQSASRASRRPSICRCCGSACAIRKTTLLSESRLSVVTFPLLFRTRQPVHAAALRRLGALHADGAARHLDHAGVTAAAGAGPDSAIVSRRWRACSASSGAPTARRTTRRSTCTTRR